MDMTNANTLADRVEGAEKESADLFIEAWLEIATNNDRAWAVGAASRLAELITAEAWLSAAEMLVPEGVEWGARWAKLPDGSWAGIGRVVQSDGIGCNTGAATPALALVASALRARNGSNTDV